MLGLPQSAGGDLPEGLHPRSWKLWRVAWAAKFSTGEMSGKSLQKSQVSSPS